MDDSMCADNTGTCQSGMCVPSDLCEGVDCSDDNECTANLCSGGSCSNPALGDGTACTGGGCLDGACIADACEIDDDCSDDDGNECTVPVCDQSGAPSVCSESADAADGDSCAGGTGTCDGGTCVIASDPVVGAGSGSTTWQALPTTATGCTYNGTDTTCTGCTITGPSVPGGGQCGQFGAQIVGGCEVPGGVLNAQLAIDTTIAIAVSSTGDGNVTTDVTVTASNPALGTAAGLVSVDAASIFTSVGTGVPAQLQNNLNPAFAGQLLGAFTLGGNTLTLDSNAGTGLGVEIPTVATAVTPTSSPSVEFDYDTFSLTLTIQASGTPLVVDDAGCIFDQPGNPATLPVE